MAFYHAQLKPVSKTSPCPICGRPDWCGITADGGLAICMRVAEGRICPSRNGGHVHIAAVGPRRRRPTTITSIINAKPTRQDLAVLARQYATAIDPAKLAKFADGLGVTVQSLRRLGIGRCVESNAWSFPMQDAAGVIVGIRLRSDTGRKFAVTGGREGAFIPSDAGESSTILICEGPSDTAALCDLGLDAIGRPSCTGGMEIIQRWIADRDPARVIIVADADEPGRRGAGILAVHLAVIVSDVRVIAPTPPLKDARDWKRAGATRDDILDMADRAEPIRLAVESEVARGR